MSKPMHRPSPISKIRNILLLLGCIALSVNGAGIRREGENTRMDKTNLVEIDLTADTTSFSMLADDIKKTGKLELVDFKQHPKASPFRADITSLNGVFAYTVQGKDRTYTIGADTLAKLSIASGLPVVCAEKTAVDFRSSKNFSKLIQAVKRQKTKAIE